MRTIEISVEGNTYIWNGETWTDERFLRPPSRVRHQLMRQLIGQLRRAPVARLDVDLVLAAASVSIDEGHPDDARGLAQLMLESNPRHVEAARVLATALRRLRQPRLAIDVTTPFARRRNAEILTVRAAAYCDISQWDEADKLIRRALTIEDAASSPETVKVLARVILARSREAA